jgi:putative ABC transport system permease protein
VRSLDLKVIRSLSALKFQAAGVALLVGCGSGLLIAAWSSYDSLRAAKEKTYRDLAFGNVFAEVKSAPLALATRLESIPGVGQVDLRLVEDGLLRLPGTPTGRFFSLPENPAEGLDRLNLSAGDLPILSSPPEAVVHEGFAEARNLRPGDLLEVTLGGRRWKFRISGIGLSPDTIYAIGPGAPLPDNLAFGVFWMRRADLEHLTGKGHTFGHLSLSVAVDPSAHRIREEVDRILAPYGTSGSYTRQDQISNRLIENEITEQKTLAILFPAIFLSIAALQTQSTLSRLIGLERLQIATLRALGYRQGEIINHYLKLVLLMASGGSCLGVLLGTGVGRLMAGSYRSFFRFPEVVFNTGSVAILLGILSSFLPAILGAFSALSSVRRLTPAEAMRPAKPPAFRIGFLERSLAGKHLSMTGKMIQRNLLARPGRLTWNTLGMSSAWILLIMSFAWSDILENLIDERFQRLSRESLSMNLAVPVQESESTSWSGLPGVLETETYRMLPVRIRFGHHQKNLLLMGSPLHPNLDRPSWFDPDPIPEGLLLSRTFRESWRLRVGDPVEFEPLSEGSRKFQLRVSGFYQDNLGLSARVPKWMLHHELNEEPVFNRILLRVDPSKENEVLESLRNAPSGSGVQSKRAVVLGFEQTLGTLIRVSTLILASFAWVMTLSLLIHSLRISTSERQREIATIRVLGLDFSKAFGLLVAETGIQWAFAAPIGVLLGNVLTRAALNAMHAEEYDFTVVISGRTYASALLIIGGSFLLGTWRMRKISMRVSLPQALKTEE